MVSLRVLYLFVEFDVVGITDGLSLVYLLALRCSRLCPPDVMTTEYRLKQQHQATSKDVFQRTMPENGRKL